jgi:hypothetical protein
MSNNYNYTQLYKRAINTLDKYSLGSMANGIDIARIHQLIRDNRTTLIECNSFEKAKVLADKIFYQLSGFQMSIETFISDEADLRTLYNVLVDWRDSLLRDDRYSMHSV